MTPDRVMEVLLIYRKKFERMGISRKGFPLERLPASDPEYLGHCYGMLDEMETFLNDGRMDKVFRWLGFIQGVLWTTGTYTIEELKNHNRP